MDLSQTEDAGVISRILDQFPVKVCLEEDALSENVRSAMSRGLREAGPCAPHDRILSIASGGPSLEDTWQQLTGVTVAVNGSLGFLLEKGVTPWACGVFDPRSHLADIIEPHPDVFFFLGSTCHPRVFEKLAGCKIVLWHQLGIHRSAPGAKYLIDGGSTMGLRWLTLGHFMGFRRFDCHGLDSSFRGSKTHAYPDYRDGMEQMELCGYQTSLNFIAQIRDWFEGKAVFDSLGDGTDIRLFGDGLLQHLDRECAC